jgi:hypothetical protein
MTQKRISAAVFTKVKNGFTIFFGGENEKKHYIRLFPSVDPTNLFESDKVFVFLKDFL